MKRVNVCMLCCFWLLSTRRGLLKEYMARNGRNEKVLDRTTELIAEGLIEGSK